MIEIWIGILLIVLAYVAYVFIPSMIRHRREVKALEKKYERDLLMIDIRSEIKMEVMNQMYEERARRIREGE